MSFVEVRIAIRQGGLQNVVYDLPSGGRRIFQLEEDCPGGRLFARVHGLLFVTYLFHAAPSSLVPRRSAKALTGEEYLKLIGRESRSVKPLHSARSRVSA
jgi:hypothetical protein